MFEKQDPVEDGSHRTSVSSCESKLLYIGGFFLKLSTFFSNHQCKEHMASKGIFPDAVKLSGASALSQLQLHSLHSLWSQIAMETKPWRVGVSDKGNLCGCPNPLWGNTKDRSCPNPL